MEDGVDLFEPVHFVSFDGLSFDGVSLSFCSSITRGRVPRMAWRTCRVEPCFWIRSSRAALRWIFETVQQGIADIVAAREV
jgi:hypothetical protein